MNNEPHDTDEPELPTDLAPRPEGYNLPALRTTDPFQGLAQAPVSPQQQQILTRPIDVNKVDILPTGEPFVQQIEYRRTLNEAFGSMGWGMKPLSPLTLRDDIMFREWALYVNGRYVSQAVGEQEYFADNDRQTYATAAESVKSNALIRCCKDLGIASECWDRRFAYKFREEHCVKVRVRKRNGQIVNAWRRKDAPPFDFEVGDAPTREQQPGGTAPPPAQIAQPPEHKAYPSDVFKAATERGWSTKQANAFVQKRFGKMITELEKGAECAKAVEAIRNLAADEPA